MTFDQARRVADAVLRDGASLHPYCSAETRNQVRWQFGVLAPPAAGAEQISKARTECLVAGERGAELQVRLRFLRLPAEGDQDDPGPAEEVEVLGSLGHPHETAFELPGTGEGPGRQLPLSGLVRLSAQPLEGAWRLRVEVENRTSWGRAADGRDAMLARSMVSAHTLLSVGDGEFVSLLDPPEWARSAAENCRNLHTWPVLVGAGRQVVLSCPVILYDNPEAELLESSSS